MKIPATRLFLRFVFPVAFVLLACTATVDLGTPQPSSPLAPTMGAPGSVPPLGRRTKTSGCVAANALPDPACTPGAVFADATVNQICTAGYTSSVRNVPPYIKDRVYAEYGIATHEPGQYEVDHLIPLELGGSNGIANLWPEPADPTPGFHEKDRVENYLHDEVCSGRLPLEQAQYAIATNWLATHHTLP